MASMAISRFISVKDIGSIVGKEVTHEQITEKLRIEHLANKGLSSMSVQRFCKKNNIGRNCKLSKEELTKEVFHCTSEVNFDTVFTVFQKSNSMYWKFTNSLFLKIVHCIKDAIVLKTGNASYEYIFFVQKI